MTDKKFGGNDISINFYWESGEVPDGSIPIRVSSTFEIGISFFSLKSGNQCSFVNRSSINAP